MGGELEPALYGRRIAEIYDQTHSVPPDADAAAGFLHSLAGGGRALELGIGTGRVALPLAAMGVEVHGIDASSEMLALLAEKPGGRDLHVSTGDFADVDVEGDFQAVYAVLSTFFMLPTQDDQLRCFHNVARHLQPGGCFVIQVFHSGLRELIESRALQVRSVSGDRVVLEAGTHDSLAQRLLMQRVAIDERGVHLYPVELRYTWPGELDLMGRLAGLRLRERWGDWGRQEMTESSPWNISVYEKPR